MFRELAKNIDCRSDTVEYGRGYSGPVMRSWYGASYHGITKGYLMFPLSFGLGLEDGNVPFLVEEFQK